MLKSQTLIKSTVGVSVRAASVHSYFFFLAVNFKVITVIRACRSPSALGKKGHLRTASLTINRWTEINLKVESCVWLRCVSVTSALCSLRSKQEVPLVLPVEGDGRRGLHEAAGARRNALLLQGRLQHLRARGVRGENVLRMPDTLERKLLRWWFANPFHDHPGVQWSSCTVWIIKATL